MNLNFEMIDNKEGNNNDAKDGSLGANKSKKDKNMKKVQIFSSEVDRMLL